MGLKFVQLNQEGEKHLGKVREILSAQPDVVNLQEAYLSDVKVLAQEFGYYYSYSTHTKLKLGAWGVAILTKAPQNSSTRKFYSMTEGDITELATPAIPHPRTLLTVEITVDGADYTFATTHFTWVMPEDADVVQAQDLTRFLALLRTHKSFILSGDFNAPRGGLVQRTLASEYHYTIPNSVTTTVDQDLHRVKGLQLVVDHLFSTPDYEVTNVEVKSGYSDHCAIFASINKLTN